MPIEEIVADGVETVFSSRFPGCLDDPYEGEFVGCAKATRNETWPTTTSAPSVRARQRISANAGPLLTVGTVAMPLFRVLDLC